MSKRKSTFRSIVIIGILLLGGVVLLPPQASAAAWAKVDMGKPYDGTVSGGLYGVTVGDGNRDNKTEVYFNCYDNAHLYQYAFIDGKWSSKDLGALGRGVYGNDVLIGDADDSGQDELYATALNSDYNVHVYQVEPSGNSWTRTDMGTAGYYRSYIDIGDGNNDNRTELYATDSYYGGLYQFTKSNTWNSQQVGTTPIYNYYGYNYNAYIFGVVVGDGDNDGDVEVYAAVGDNHVYRWNYTGVSWKRTDMGTGEPRSDFWNGMQRVAIGDADNDDNDEVYAVSYYNATVWRYKWNSANSKWDITKLATLGANINANALSIGDGNSDGDQELYVGCSNRQVYEVLYDAGSWSSSSVGSGNSAMNDVDLGSATNDTKQVEIYAACGDGHAYQFFMDSTPPANPIVWSDTHPNPGTWYTETVVHVLWKDQGFDISGIDGYSVEWSTSSSTLPDTSRDLQQSVHEATSPPLADSDNWYFHIRARDNALNWNASATHFGPIRIDTRAPYDLRLSINDGAEFTADKLVTLSLSATDPSPGSGVAWMAFSNDGSKWGEWESFCATRSGWDLTAAKYGGSDTDGDHKVHAKVKDLVGHEVSEQNRTTATIFLDRVAPGELGIVIDGGAAYATSDTVTLSISAKDPTPASGLWKMTFSNDGTNYGNWTDWNEKTQWSLTTGPGGEDTDGSKTVSFWVKDRAGNIGGPVRDSIFLDRKAPENLSLVIDDGAEYTNNAAATLAILAFDPVPGSELNDMTLANSQDSLGSWETFADSKSGWSLISGTGGTDTDGQKTVYLKVRDKAGNIGGPVSDSVFLDRVKPGPLGIMINDGAKYTTTNKVMLALKASDPDPASGVELMQFSDDGIKWSEWEAYTSQKGYMLPAPDGLKTVYFRVKDRAGNLADAASSQIILDTASPVISNVRVVGITDTSALVTWTTDEDSDSGVDFGLTSGFGSSKLDASLVTSHSVALTGLSPTTTYYFQVYSKDRAGNPAAYAGPYVFITAATPDTTPPSISSVQVSGITDSLAVVSWSTNEPADGMVEFGKDTSYGLRAVDTSFVLKHSMLLQKLEQNTVYHFRAASSDPSGNGPAVSADYTFVTLVTPDKSPPVISNIKVSGVTDRLAIISWETDEPADGSVSFGLTSSYGLTASADGLVKLHEVTLLNLKPLTTYHFRAASKDASGNGPALSEDFTFQTTALPDTTPPVLSNVRPEGVTENSALIMWETDEVSDSYVEFGLTTTYGVSSADATATLRHSVLLSGLAADKTYHFRVRSTDPSANAATSGDLTFRTKKTPSGPDIVPPQLSNIQLSGVTDTKAVLIWETDELANSEVEYGNSTAYGQRASDQIPVLVHSIVLEGLKPSTTYHLRVKSTDVSGNGPTISKDYSFTTSASPDLTPPKISNIRIINLTNSTATVTWDTDEPADGVVEFGLDASYGHNRSTAVFLMNHSVQLTGLAAGALYHIRIRSRDTSGNPSLPSADVTFTTLKTNTNQPTYDPFGTGGFPWLWLIVFIAAIVALGTVMVLYRRRLGSQLPPEGDAAAARGYYDPDTGEYNQPTTAGQSEYEHPQAGTTPDADLDAAAREDLQAEGPAGAIDVDAESVETLSMDEVSSADYGRQDFAQSQAPAYYQAPRPRGAAAATMATAATAAATPPYPAPGPRPPDLQPLRHIRCPTCRTRIPIYKEGPQEVACPGCGKRGPYRPKGVGALAATMPEPEPEQAPAPVVEYQDPYQNQYQSQSQYPPQYQSPSQYQPQQPEPSPEASAFQEAVPGSSPIPVRMTKCMACGSQVPVYSANYPTRITCPGCGRSGLYKGPKAR